jgi:hypothetical protein
MIIGTGNELSGKSSRLLATNRKSKRRHLPHADTKAKNTEQGRAGPFTDTGGNTKISSRRCGRQNKNERWEPSARQRPCLTGGALARRRENSLTGKLMAAEKNQKEK